MSNYVSLHTHSDYSFLDSIAKISDLTNKARSLNMPGLALTDHGNICGWLKFYSSCKYDKDDKPLPKDKALKPILGIEAYICDDSLLPSKIDERIEELEAHKKTTLGSLFEWASDPEAFEDSDFESGEEELENLDHEESTVWHHRISKMLNENRKNNFDAENQITFLKESKVKVKKSNHLILLAKNRTGFNNIIKLSSYGYQNGLFYKHRIDMKILEQHKDGLIVLSACLGGQISSSILKDNMKKAEEYVKEYKRIFGQDFYLELQLHEIEEQRKANKGLIELMKKYKVQPVITQDIHYVEKEDVELHEIVIKLRKNQKDDKKEDEEKESEDSVKKALKEAEKQAEKKEADAEDSDGYFYTARGLYFKSYDELIESWHKEHPYIDEKIFNKAIDNTMVIFNKVEEFQVRSEKPLLPEYDTKGLTPREFIKGLMKKGAKERLLGKIKEKPELKAIYESRMIEELDTICELNFEQYFLIVWDIMNWCKEHDILTGPGRGSAVGSLISYLLGITHLDPVEHDLLFSRFINKSRSSARYRLEFLDMPMVKK